MLIRSLGGENPGSQVVVQKGEKTEVWARVTRGDDGDRAQGERAASTDREMKWTKREGSVRQIV